MRFWVRFPDEVSVEAARETLLKRVGDRKIIRMDPPQRGWNQGPVDPQCSWINSISCVTE
jgi:hypothetical protein